MFTVWLCARILLQSPRDWLKVNVYGTSWDSFIYVGTFECLTIPKDFCFFSCVLDNLFYVSFIIFCPMYLWVVSSPAVFFFFFLPSRNEYCFFCMSFRRSETGKSLVSIIQLSSWTCSVKFSCSVMSDSLQPHRLQQARPPCLGVYPNSCPSSWWCHPTISSSVIPFSSYLQSFPASGSFPVSWFFESGGQSIGVSDSTSVLPMLEERYTTVCE